MQSRRRRQRFSIARDSNPSEWAEKRHQTKAERGSIPTNDDAGRDNAMASAALRDVKADVFVRLPLLPRLIWKKPKLARAEPPAPQSKHDHDAPAATSSARCPSSHGRQSRCAVVALRWALCASRHRPAAEGLCVWCWAGARYATVCHVPMSGFVAGFGIGELALS